MTIEIPDFALVALVGSTGSGKSTFAARHFKPTEILSSDTFRGLVSDDENSLDATQDAFDMLHRLAAVRLKNRRLTVVDATNVQPESRKPLLQLAKEYHCFAVAIVLNMPERLCHARNATRPNRDFGPHVVRSQLRDLRRSRKGLRREGFRYVFELNSPEEVDQVHIERRPIWSDRRGETGPFDIIGDVHGCATELEYLLDRLGYRNRDGVFIHPDRRKAIFLGDIADRGPRIVDAFRIVMAMCEAGHGLCVPGNHDVKLLRKLRGRNVRIAHGLQQTLDQIEALDEASRTEFTTRVEAFIDGLVSHYVLDEGKLVVAHAGLREELQGRASGRVREFALYGETTGETDEFGLPVRYNWASEYRGKARVIYGHTPVPEAEWLNGTMNIDTGCVFGGRLTALRYPEMEVVQIDAENTYAEPARPFLEAEPDAMSGGESHVLDLQDVIGKQLIDTSLIGRIIIKEGHTAAAIESISRFAIDPKWLIYLPPTMAPPDASQKEGWLEYPEEAFADYRNAGIHRVICQEKHMGSRAVVVVCRDEEAARRRFGVSTGESGIVYTRTGRRFFADTSLEQALLAELRHAIEQAGLWNRLDTDWLCLDCELMPWSAKAQALLRQQYAAVGAASNAVLPHAVQALERADERGIEMGGLLERFASRRADARAFSAAYRRYCWPVDGLDGLKLAPFHILASEGAVHVDKDHAWHIEEIRGLASYREGLFHPTTCRRVDLLNEGEVGEVLQWWEALTDRGSEGMVVKPISFVARGARGLAQPAVKCRGREYLRIIYGPSYTEPENLKRLRRRSVGKKRSLALREFALGIEGLERFVRREPLRRVHTCVLGVLALESEPVDPRL